MLETIRQSIRNAAAAGARRGDLAITINPQSIPTLTMELQRDPNNTNQPPAFMQVDGIPIERHLNVPRGGCWISTRNSI